MALTAFGRVPRLVGSLPGKMIVMGENSTTGAAAEKVVIAAPTDLTHRYHITTLVVCLDGASGGGPLLIKDGASGATILTLPIPGAAATSINPITFMDQGGMRLSAGKALVFTSTGIVTGTVRVFANGFEDSD